MYNVVQVTKSGLSREEFMSSTGEAIIQNALTDSRVGDLAVGKTGMANLGASLVQRGGENITTDLLGNNPDGTARGGYLPPSYARKFQEWAKDAVPLLPLIHSFEMPSTRTVISRIGLGDRVLHGSSEMNPMSDAQKSRLLYGSQEFTTQKYMGQLDMSYEMLEDTIEQGNLRSRILKMLGEQVGADQEYIIINSDTSITAAHPYADYAAHWDLLNKQDGLIKRCFSMIPSGRPGEGKVGANRVDVAGATIDVPKWYSLEYALPEKYRKDSRPYMWLRSRVIDMNWRQYLTDRPTSVGDTYILKEQEAQSLGLRILTCPQLPHDVNVVGTAIQPGDRAFVFLIQPQNIAMGWWRNILVETTKDIERQVYKIVISMRLGFSIFQPDAIAFLTNVGTHY